MRPTPWLAALTLGLLAQTGLSMTASAADKTCPLEIAGNDMMQFDQKELVVAAECTQVTLTLKHTGKLPPQSMGHNWVLTKNEDAAALATAGMAAGAKSDYLPPGDKRILAATKMIGGGQSTSVTFATLVLKKGTTYTFLCTFPGHATIMKGMLKFG